MNDCSIRVRPFRSKSKAPNYLRDACEIGDESVRNIHGLVLVTFVRSPSRNPARVIEIPVLERDKSAWRG